ncbi:secretion protein EspA [Parashewanella spongiae]|uniref:Secretion protein EspA n=2 Tax=Parashewanella spongiae TaxID=342950 RepID=A0A3A6THF2_9GAMM|nr:secretion protein EspA [Parashewanella spongiae]
MSFYSEQYQELNKTTDIKSTIDVDRQLATEGDSVLSGGIAVLYLFMNLLSELADNKYLQMQQKAKVSRDSQDKANEVNEKIAEVAKQGADGTATLPQDVIDYMRDNGIMIDGKGIGSYLGKPINHQNNVSVTLTSSDGKKMPVHHYEGQYTIYGQGGYTPVEKAIADGTITSFEGSEEPGSPITLVKDGVTYTGVAPNYEELSEGVTDGLANVKLDKGKLEAVKAALENVSNRASDFVSQSQLQLQKVMQTYNVTVSLLNSMQTMLEEMNKSIAQNVR